MFKSVVLATKNKVKHSAVKEVISEYDDIFPMSEVMLLDVESGVPEQPIGFDQIIQGAKNRAMNSFLEAHTDIAVGIEDGIAEVPHTRTGYMNFCCCAVYDGHEFFIGMSGGYEYPLGVVKDVIHGKKNITDSFFERGLTKNPKIGAYEGAIGVMSKGRENRVDATKSAVRRALMQIENRDMF